MQETTSKDGTTTTTYVERVIYFCKLLNPLHLFKSESEIQRAVGKRENEFLVASSVHPDTHQIIPAPLRIAAIVPMNIPIIAGLLLTRPTLTNILTWQFLNQSYNFAVNYANGNHSAKNLTQNKGEKEDNKGLILAYVAAVTSSCATAVGLERLAQRFHSPLLSKGAPILAVTLAGALNVLMVRSPELWNGIAVYDVRSDALVDSSHQGAAWKAISQVMLTRVATSLGVLALPQLVFYRYGSRMGPLSRLAVITASLQIALPLSLALFPQRGTLVHNVNNRNTASDNNKWDQKIVYFNKGL